MEEKTTARSIVQRALTELAGRERALKPIVTRAQGELSETSRFIKAFEKALGVKATPPPPLLPPNATLRRGPSPGGESPRSRFTTKVVELLTNSDGRSAESIASHFGTNHNWTQGVLTKAVERGLLKRDGSVYSVPE